jgi:hypothetical protein
MTDLFEDIMTQMHDMPVPLCALAKRFCIN